MIPLFPLIVGLQAYCLYHAYKNHAEQKWYWLIVLFPLLGCCIYIYYHLYSERNTNMVTEGVEGVVISNYRVERMENQLEHCSSMTNKILLADEYIEIERFVDAIELYESCLVGFNKNDVGVLMKLVYLYHAIQNYEMAIVFGDRLMGDVSFKKSEEKIFYAWSLFEENKLELAEKTFKEMDVNFSNYPQRIEYIKFLDKIGKKSEALAKLEKLNTEYNSLEPYRKKILKNVGREIWNLKNKME